MAIIGNRLQREWPALSAVDIHAELRRRTVTINALLVLNRVPNHFERDLNLYGCQQASQIRGSRVPALILLPHGEIAAGSVELSWLM